MGTEEVRPSFYALRPGGWRDYVTLLHPPYTAWHLSYVAVGAAIAPQFHLERLVWALVAFALALGVSAHALDELKSRPLRTEIGSTTLAVLAIASLVGAAAIGIWAALAWGLGLLAFVAVGAFLVPAYNLELFGGRFHSDWWFALSWGAFPALTGFFVEAQSIRLEAVVVAAYATALSLAQRRLSTSVRHARRTRGTLAGVEPLEQVLRTLGAAAVLLACGLVAARLT
ncbi:MAG TPA: hypothetical protein VH721_10155 [Gaiellaceae bacterium]|jgi:hypothetical protein